MILVFSLCNRIVLNIYNTQCTPLIKVNKIKYISDRIILLFNGNEAKATTKYILRIICFLYVVLSFPGSSDTNTLDKYFLKDVFKLVLVYREMFFKLKCHTFGGNH